LKFFFLDESTSPAAWVFSQISHLLNDINDQSFAMSFKCPQPYLPGQLAIDLVAIIHVNTQSQEPVIHLCMYPLSAGKLPDIYSLSEDLASIASFAHRNHFPILNISAPWDLLPVQVPKPWGREIWFTGIEERGQTGVKGIDGALPLPWVLAIFPQATERSLILLKVLDPLPDEVYGDLYFELHEEKQEVYVVTHIDTQAWPEGIGYIQLGFSPARRSAYANDDEFKKAYLDAVEKYEKVRRALDKKLDGFRQQKNIDLSAPVSSIQLKKWINNLSQSIEYKELIQNEQRLRQVMNDFINYMPLAVGDTLAIPRFVPHALQHGVRVVEFQTPVYERKILSFAQKVLTQNHWDTREALSIANMDHPFTSRPEVTFSSDVVTVEQIVNFDDFVVQRIHLQAGTYDAEKSGYGLLMPITGELIILWEGNRRSIKAGEASLLPGSLMKHCKFMADDACLFLYAIPKV
jgi:hypothetical protein